MGVLGMHMLCAIQKIGLHILRIWKLYANLQTAQYWDCGYVKLDNFLLLENTLHKNWKWMVLYGVTM